MRRGGKRMLILPGKSIPLSGVEQNISKDKHVPGLYRQLLRTGKQDLDETEFSMLRQALDLALKVCEELPLKLGEPVMVHALGVSLILAGEIGLGASSIISALLYDFYLEDRIQDKDLEGFLDSRIIGIIHDLAKISGVDTQKSTDQAGKLRNLLLTLSGDVRVILVMLADRLYVMRRLDTLDRSEQLRIAAETFYIYAPLAHRLGLYNIKSEMEDLHLRCTDPKAFRYVNDKLKETRTSREKLIGEFIRPLDRLLAGKDLIYEIKGRTKSIYSIWTKMNQQNVDFEEVYDLFAIRVILDSPPAREKSDCWNVYSMVTDLYQPNPDRLRDWISAPKSNGYESLHTTVVVPGGRWVEVQIRTRRMNEIAERGLAAHWKYKEGSDQADMGSWLNKIREVLESPDPDAGDIIDDFKLSIYNKEIFVFTPKGDLKKFSAGATVLDFAFDVHSQVGMTCTGAKINGKNVPIRHRLTNGDKVEIVTSKSQRPNQDWLKYVVTSKAKSKIKQALQEDRLARAKNGREILRRRFRNWKLEFEDTSINKLLRHYKLKTATDLYSMVATDKIDLLEIKDIVKEKTLPESPSRTTEIGEEAVDRLVSGAVKQDDYLVIDENLDKIDHRLGKCCNPIHGDEIFGFVTVKSGITIHRVNCPNAAQLISKHGYRVVRAQWADKGSQTHFPVAIRITGEDDIGILSKISDLISKDLRVNMRSITIDTTDGMFEGSLTLFVRDTSHLDVLIKRLAKIRGVLNVSRMER